MHRAWEYLACEKDPFSRILYTVFEIRPEPQRKLQLDNGKQFWLPAVRRGVVDAPAINSWSPVSAMTSSLTWSLIEGRDCFAAANRAVLVCNSLHRHVRELREALDEFLV